MLLRSSSSIYPSIHLLTLGATCRYAITAEDTSITLSDPGATIHVSNLAERLQQLDLHPERISRVLMTHLDADRIAGVPLLRRMVPDLKLCGSAAMHAQLQDQDFVRALWQRDQEITSWFSSQGTVPEIPFEEFRRSLAIDHYLVESDTIALDDDLIIRAVSSPGHRRHSMSYIVVPHEFIIADETFGYNQGRRLVAPGGDFDIRIATRSIKLFSHLEISGIGLPYVGAITGELATKHLDMVVMNTNDLITQVQHAHETGIPDEEIRKQVRDAFYNTALRDPCLIHSLQQSFDAIWKQVRPTSM
jgi:glyoxylase-like metal-dependent hydrolase (beta-lactamase superfamily II)